MNRGLAGKDANSLRLNSAILLRIELCQKAVCYWRLSNTSVSRATEVCAQS